MIFNSYRRFLSHKNLIKACSKLGEGNGLLNKKYILTSIFKEKKFVSPMWSTLHYDLSGHIKRSFLCKL